MPVAIIESRIFDYLDLPQGGTVGYYFWTAQIASSIIIMKQLIFIGQKISI